MTRLSRHVSLTVLNAMLLVQLLLLGLDLVFSFIGELDRTSGDYGALEAFRYVALSLPRHVYDILPMSALIGALVGLGTLASASELTVMRAAGISTLRIVWWVMRGALLIIALGLFLGEKVVPVTERLADSGKARAQGQDYQANRFSGYWQREGDEIFNIRQIDLAGELIGISRFRHDDEGRLVSASFAEAGRWDGKGWRLTGVRETRIAGDGRSRISHQAEVSWPVSITPEFLSVAASNPEQLGLADLLTYARYLKAQKLDAGAWELQFWKKLLAPVAVFSMVLVACSFIFGPLRSVTLGLRIITGVLVGLLFRYTQDAFGFASLVFHWSPLVALLIPVLGCLMAGLWALYRVR